MTAMDMRPAVSPQVRNERAYETTVTVQGLPSLERAAWEATDTSVLVTATDMSVLADWFFVQHGSVSRVELAWGQTVWSLHTTTWSDSPTYPRVPVVVTVVLPSSALVMQEIEEAVAR